MLLGESTSDTLRSDDSELDMDQVAYSLSVRVCRVRTAHALRMNFATFATLVMTIRYNGKTNRSTKHNVFWEKVRL